jgi:hypothetical protein
MRAAAALDAATAACAALNLAYFLFRLALRRDDTPPRTVATLALALVCLGAVGESLYFLASLTVPHAGSPLGALVWTLLRLASLAGLALVSALVLRRLLAEPWPEETG